MLLNLLLNFYLRTVGKSTLVVIKDADATNSADADDITLSETICIKSCEPLAANEADDLACDADVNNDDVANNIEAVFCPTSSNTVLIDEVSAFKEPVVRSISSARNISEAESAPTLLNLVLKEPVANPNELDTSARTIDDDVNAPPANNDADVSAPCPNNAPDVRHSPKQLKQHTDTMLIVILMNLCSLVNSKLSVKLKMFFSLNVQ